MSDTAFDPNAVSKTIAYYLRHKPSAGGLVLDDNGWTDLGALLHALRSDFPVSSEDVRRIVETDPKQRYSIRDDRIRANQGHSVDVDLALAPTSPPAVLFHGTVQRFLGSILRDGLVKGARTHVHLSPDVPTALTVAQRRKGSAPVILTIDAKAMAASGASFFCSENGVWLVDFVPPAYISVLADPRRTSR